MRSLPQNSFGLNTSPEIPDQCKIEQVHLVHRHGARYSTSTGPIASFAGRLHNATVGSLLNPRFSLVLIIFSSQRNSTIKASGELSFLNKWTYKLGSEILSPFGREQL